jgi:hypothetical protein
LRVYRNSISESGYILLYTLFISFLIISVILFTIVSIFFLNERTVREINKKKLELACFSCLQKHISTLRIPENKGIFLNFDSKSVSLTCRIRGMFYEIKVKVKNRLDSSEVVYLMGNRIIPPFDNAVIISYPLLRVAVAGNTKINGNILAASDNFTYGNILGIESIRKEYVFGKIITSSKIKEKLFNESIYLINKNPGYEFDYKILPGDFILNSSSLPTLDSSKNFIINGNLILEGILNHTQKFISNTYKVKGKTIIRSGTQSQLDLQVYTDSSATVNNNSIIENLNLYSQKEINIKANCKLTNTQLLAEKNISVFESELKYPSIAGIYVKTDLASNLKNEINILSSKVNGAIMLLSSATGINNNQSKIFIDGKSSVQGLIYSENYSEINGNITGILYTNQFRFYKGPTEYLNWLVNLNVNRNKLSHWFLLPIGFSEKPELEILDEKWIY